MPGASVIWHFWNLSHSIRRITPSANDALLMRIAALMRVTALFGMGADDVLAVLPDEANQFPAQAIHYRVVAIGSQ